MKRPWLLGVVLVLVTWGAVTQLGQARALYATLAHGQGEWVLLSLLLQALYFLCYAALYQAALRVVAVRLPIRALLPAVLAGTCADMVVPTSGNAVLLEDAVRRGQPAGSVTAGLLLLRLADLTSLGVVLGAGLFYLARRQDLAPYEVAATGLLAAVIAGLCVLLWLGGSRPERVVPLLRRAQSSVDRVAAAVHRPSPLPRAWAEVLATDFGRAAGAMARHPGRLVQMVGLGLLVQALDMACLEGLFLAFHTPVSLGVLVAGFGVGILFWMISITPHGVGVVEGVMVLVFTSLGVPLERATVVVMAFRGVTLWLPVLLGAIALRSLRASPSPRVPVHLDPTG